MTPTATQLDDDNDRLGVPYAGLKVQPLPDHRQTSTEEPTLRCGDPELGRPLGIPERVTPLSSADREVLLQAEQEQAQRDLDKAQELVASDPAVGWLGWFAHPLAAALLIGGAGVLGLFLYSQVLAILANIAMQPVWVQWIGYAALAVCAGAVAYAVVRFLLLYVQLKRNRQIRLAGLAELQERTRLRWLAHEKAAEARDQLAEYLRRFPINTPKEQKALATMGATPEQVKTLLTVRETLLDPAKYTTSSEWFRTFQMGFQGTLDQAANSRILYWAKRCGLATAVAPNGLIDTVAATYFGFALMTDLCKLYHLRAGKTGTAALLGRVFFNSYLAGQLNDWEKLTEEQYQHLMGEMFAAKALAKVGAKATSGLLNFFLIQRLGKYAMRLLQPVA
jgi:putative membrane protein